MTRSAVRQAHVRPTDVTVQQLTVAAVSRPSPGFVRVTLRADDATSEFTDRGLDQWVRLFLPVTPSGPLVLPWGGSEGWYLRWQGLPDHRRPTVRNYTVRGARRDVTGWDLDVDLVVHRSADGTVDGVAAAWALAVQPGDQVGLLEQGVLFRADLRTDAALLLLSDESGLPGVEAVLRALPRGLQVETAVEVPDVADIRDLPSPSDLQVDWLVRPAGTSAGSLLVAHLERLPPTLLRPSTYLYAVGEAGFTSAVQKRAQALGLAADQVDACAYWAGRRART